MLFTYTYRSSDGQRHTAEIEAENRDAAFAKVRSELGVKPIKVVAAAPSGDGQLASLQVNELASSEKGGNSHTRTLANALTAIAAIAAIAIGAWLYLSRRPVAPADDLRVSASLREPYTLAAAPAARPRPRAQIEGFGGIDLEKAFDRASERFLSRYAMPGERTDGSAPPEGLAEELIATIKAPIPIAECDGDAERKLKGVVAGIKADVMLLLASGQGINDVLLWLESRQKMEAEYRDRIVSGLRARPSSKDETNRLLRSLGLREAE